MPTAFVTGASGLIGLPTVRELVDADWQVVASDVANLDRLTGIGDVQVLERDVAAVTRADLEGVDAVIHLGALTLSAEKGRFGAETDLRDARPMLSVNVMATEHLFRTACEVGVPAVVYASTAAVYGPPSDAVSVEGGAYPSDGPFRPSSVYAHTKLMCEGLAGHYSTGASTRFVGMRPTFSYGLERLTGISGAFAQFIVDAVRGEAAELGAPFGRSGRLQLIYVDDMARSLVSCTEVARRGWAGDSSSIVLNSPTTETLSLAEIVDILVEETGNPRIGLAQADFDRELLMPLMDTRFSAQFLGFEQRFRFREAVREIARRVQAS